MTDGSVSLSYGLPAQITLSANTLASRTSTLGFDSKGRFVTNITNPLSHFVSRKYDQGTGNLLSETGIDNNTTRYQYDGFGRLKKTVTPQGNEINSNIAWDESNTGGENSIYYVLTTSPTLGKPDEYVYFDVSGRKLMIKTDGLVGQVTQVWNYSTGGILSSISWPYKSGDTYKVISYSYDAFGRLMNEDNNGLVTLTTHDNNKTTITNSAYQTKSTITNSAGNVVQIIENNNNTINYDYNSNGQIKSVSTAGTAVSYAYDEYGRKTSIADPNSGTTSYVYNAFGELVSQTDAKNNTYSFQYDLLGRVTTKTGPEGTTSYTYIGSGNGIEQTDSIKGSDNISQKYSYSNFGQVTSLAEKIPGDQSMTTSFSYDTWGKNTGITYPSGVSVTNVYNADGYLNEIKKGTYTIWKLDSLNSEGQPVQYSLGASGLNAHFKYDSKGYLTNIKTGNREQSFSFNPNTGNLNSRNYQYNSTTLLTESFSYDAMNRLTSYRGNNSLQYDDNGNITSKSDAGTHSYDGSKVNAVTSITGNGGSISDTLQEITYTGFNMTASVSENPYTIDFTYGPDNQRVKSLLKNNGATIKTKYFSPGYEKEVTTSGTREITYINSPYGLEAVDIKKNGADSLYYVESDHLGSIIGLVRADGTYKERYSYDAWGRRRNPKNWSYDTIPAATVIDRGFTGHEHLDMFGLINMLSETDRNEMKIGQAKSRKQSEAGNGRMYDPVIGRFLGVDPFIQFGDNSQSFNGYSYCLNNPVRYTDPSGYNVYNIRKENWAKLLAQGGIFDADALGREYGELVFDDSDSNSQGSSVGGGTYGPLAVYNFTATDGTKINVLTYDPRKWGGDYGEFRIEVRVKGNYSIFNEIQSYKVNNTWLLDDHGSGEHGFFYDRLRYNDYNSKDLNEYYTKGYDLYTVDQPQGYPQTPFQSTICGLNTTWVPIFTFSWEYSISNQILNFYVRPAPPEKGHQDNIDISLDYWNHHEF